MGAEQSQLPAAAMDGCPLATQHGACPSAQGRSGTSSPPSCMALTVAVVGVRGSFSEDVAAVGAYLTLEIAGKPETRCDVAVVPQNLSNSAAWNPEVTIHGCMSGETIVARLMVKDLRCERCLGSVRVPLDDAAWRPTLALLELQDNLEAGGVTRQRCALTLQCRQGMPFPDVSPTLCPYTDERGEACHFGAWRDAEPVVGPEALDESVCCSCWSAPGAKVPGTI